MRRLTTDEFIAKVEAIYGDALDLSEVYYIDRDTDVIVTCKLCKTRFVKKPRYFYEKRKYICPTCSAISDAKRKLKTTETFINEAINVHGDKYDYSFVEYAYCTKKVSIKCNKCGFTFDQKPAHHLSGSGCLNCNRIRQGDRKRLTKEQFIQRAIEDHGDKYDYRDVAYVDSKHKVKVVCKSCGKTYSVRPDAHMSGTGCKCQIESQGEKAIKKVLDERGIRYKQEKTFEGCKRQRKLRYDFYLPDNNTLIEYDGRQHFYPFYAEGMSKKKAQRVLDLQIESDRIKTEFAKNNGINLIRIKFTELAKVSCIIDSLLL